MLKSVFQNGFTQLCTQMCEEIIRKVQKSMNFKTVKMAMARFHTPMWLFGMSGM
jgi:hypothetical protein